MYINELTFDEFIEIEIPRGDDWENFVLNTKVDSAGDGVLKAAVPDNVRLLEEISEVYVYYKRDGICKRWTCELLGFTRSNEILLIVLFCNKKSENANLRSAFRLSYVEDMEYEFGDTKIKAKYKDISATGIGFYTNTKHKIGDELTFVINDKGFNIEVDGRIVRVEVQEEKNSLFKYLNGVQFHETNEEIMKFIFAKQSEIIRKRRLSL